MFVEISGLTISFLLFPSGFLAIWIVPVFSMDQFPKYKPNWLAIIGYRWFITRIMLGAGLIKGGVISKSFFSILSYPQKPKPNHCLTTFLYF